MSRIVSIVISLFVVTVLLGSCTNSKRNIVVKANVSLKSIDGPYIYKKKDSVRVVEVVNMHDSIFSIQQQCYLYNPNQLFNCNVSNVDKDIFSFSLMDEYVTPSYETKPNGNIFITSDIEGNFNTFYSMLVGNGVMNTNYEWTFGSGSLAIAGDMVDRGDNVLPCLWLLYKLEKEAKLAGGSVHYILGNHDVMNLQLDLRYVDKKYLKLAKILSGKEDEKEAFKVLMSKNSELIKWMSSKNTIEKIGKNLILHGGISPDIVDAELSLQEINELVRKYAFENLMRNPGDDESATLVFGRMGPLWYRGMVYDYKEYYKKLSLEDVDAILEFYDVEHIIIGHTIVDDKITSDYNGKVIRVDIKHPKQKFSGKSQALLIEKNTYYMVNDMGNRVSLPRK